MMKNTHESERKINTITAINIMKSFNSLLYLFQIKYEAFYFYISNIEDVSHWYAIGFMLNNKNPMKIRK